MRFILDCTVKDLRRRFADPVAILIWVGIPVLIGSLLGMISGGGNSTPTARLLIVDEDDSMLSALLVGAANQDAMGEFLDAETVDLQRGRTLMDAGEASAMLIIPDGFGEAVLLEQPTVLSLITNPAQTILPGIIEEGLSMLVEVAFYGQRLLGPQLRAIVTMNDADEGPSMAGVSAISEQFYERIQSVEGMLFPPVLLLGEEEAATAEPDEDEDSSGGFNVVRIFLPAMLFMSILFVASGMSDDIWRESLQGTLRRLLATPRRVEQMLAGKVLAGLSIMAIVATVAMPLAWWGAGFDLARLPIALLWCMYAGGALLIYFMLIQSLATTQRGGSVLSTMVLFPLMMIGGSFFPFAAMPSWMARFGRLTPNGLALTHLEQILWGEPSAGSVLAAAATIGIPALIAFLLCSMRMRSPALVG